MAYIDPFSAIADPTRRQILTRLRAGPETVGKLAENIPVSRPAVSQHLKVLREAGLVSVTPQGTANIYALNKDGFVEILRWIDAMWSDALGAFTEHVEGEPDDNEPEDTANDNQGGGPSWPR